YPDVMIMIAQRHAQDLLGLVLLDDEAIEVRLNIPRLVLEIETVLRRFGRFFRFGLARGHLRENRRTGLKMLPHQLLELTLELFGTGRTATSAHRLQLMIRASFVN